MVYTSILFIIFILAVLLYAIHALLVLNKSRHNSVVSVAEFGAIPDDGTDQSDKINLATAFIARHNRMFSTVHIPKGTYHINKPIVLHESEFSSELDGGQNSTIVPGKDCISGINTEKCNYVILRGITVEGREFPTDKNATGFLFLE